MPSITSIGVGSGIDLEGLVTKIVDAERRPTTNRLDFEETRVQANISAFGSLKSTLDAFQTSLGKLKDASFYTKQSANSGDKTLFTASSNGNAATGTYKVEVFDMAKANKLVTNASFADPNATVGSGTLNIGFQGGSVFSIDVGATDKLSDIRDAINNATNNIGVKAALLTTDAGMGDGSTITELIITSNQTGEDSQLNISVTDDDGNHTDNSGLSRFYFDGSDPLNAGNRMAQIDAAQNARIAVDGFTAYSNSNTFTDVIDGTVLTILKDDGGAATPPTADLSIATDNSKLQTEIDVFVGHYNELMGVFKALTAYNPETKEAGLLNGDSTVRGLESRIRQIFSSIVSGASNSINSMVSIGVTTADDGSTEIDTSKLSSSISTNFNDFINLFGGTNGIATKLHNLTSQYFGSNGIFKIREDGFQQKLDEILENRISLNLRVDKIEARMRAQFSALDKLVQQLNSTGNFLSQQLDASAKIVNFKK